MAEQIQIADGIEDLVFDKLVAVTQAILVEHAELVENDGILQASAQRQTIFAQVFDFLHETEGAGAGNFADVGLLGKVDDRVLC